MKTGVGTGQPIQEYDIIAKLHYDGKIECRIPDELKGLITGKITTHAKSVSNERSYNWVCGFVDGLIEAGLLPEEDGQKHKKAASYYLNHPHEAQSPPPVL